MGLLNIGLKKIKKYYSKEERELRRLINVPRYTPCEANLIGGVMLADSLSFVAGYEEIFRRENYKVAFSSKEPFIIDCGSNIGLSIIYFKTHFPDATIMGFEPDPKIFKILKENVSKFQNIVLYNKALSDEKGILNFISEGGFSGRLNNEAAGSNIIEVETDRLSSYIIRKVDLLKVDIEGAEYEVLKEIQPKLQMIDKLFIEYHSISNKEQNLDLILALLKEEGYRVHIKEAYTARHPFVEIPVMAGMDNQLEIYASR